MTASRSRPHYAVMFVPALTLEPYRTRLGDRAWQPLVAGLGLTTTKPAVHAGAFYGALDRLVSGWLRWRCRDTVAAADLAAQ